MQCNCMMGFPEIGRAWLTIDSDVFVWTYNNAGDLAYFNSLNETILSVGLVKPKPGILEVIFITFYVWRHPLKSFYAELVLVHPLMIMELVKCIYYPNRCLLFHRTHPSYFIYLVLKKEPTKFLISVPRGHQRAKSYQ